MLQRRHSNASLWAVEAQRFGADLRMSPDRSPARGNCGDETSDDLQGVIRSLDMQLRCTPGPCVEPSDVLSTLKSDLPFTKASSVQRDADEPYSGPE